MKKNVLYISYDGMTDPLGQSQVLPYLSGISKEGYDITLISFEKIDVYEKNKNIILQLCKHASIDWKPQYYTKNPPVLSTIYDIYKLIRLVVKLNKLKNFHIVHCRSYISAFAGIYMKKKFFTKFIFDMRGFWVNERVDGNIWNLKNPIFKMIYNYFKKKELEFFNTADYTISLTENGKNEIHSWKNIKNQPIPIEVIPCCVDTDKFDANNIESAILNDFRTKLGINENDFILSYIGSIGTWYMTDEMMQFYKTLLETKENAKFLFITNTPKDEIIQYAINNNVDYSNIIVVSGKRDEMPYLISLSTFSLFFIKPLYSKKASSPTKQGEIMSLGIPIICNNNVGDTSSIIEKYHAGFVVNKFDIANYKNVILQLDTKRFSKDEIRKGAQEFYNLKKGIERYLKVYNTL